MKQQMSNMEFGRRMATEKDLEKTEVFNFCNIGEHVYHIVRLRQVHKLLTIAVDNPEHL